MKFMLKFRKELSEFTSRWLASNNIRCQMGLCRFTNHQFISYIGFEHNVFYVKHALRIIICSPLYRWSCPWCSFSCYYSVMVGMGRTTRTQHISIDRFLWNTFGYIINYASRRFSLPLFQFWLDVLVHDDKLIGIHLVDLMDNLDG